MRSIDQYRLLVSMRFHAHGVCFIIYCFLLFIVITFIGAGGNSLSTEKRSPFASIDNVKIDRLQRQQIMYENAINKCEVAWIIHDYILVDKEMGDVRTSFSILFFPYSSYFPPFDSSFSSVVFIPLLSSTTSRLQYVDSSS